MKRIRSLSKYTSFGGQIGEGWKSGFGFVVFLNALLQGLLMDFVFRDTTRETAQHPCGFLLGTSTRPFQIRIS